MFDNRVFNVNGQLERDKDHLLLAALELAFEISGPRTKAVGWIFSKECGLVLCWHGEGKDFNRFPTPLNAKSVFPIVLQWLHSEEAATVLLDGRDMDRDHDGHNGPGWRCYVGDWGKVRASSCSIVAVKRVFVWYGK